MQSRKIDGLSQEVRTDLAQAIYAGIIGAGKKSFRKLCFYTSITVIVFLAMSWLAFKSGLTRDDTDGLTRSGLALYTDTATGCQYLSANGSGITPRMDKDGYQVCKGTAK